MTTNRGVWIAVLASSAMGCGGGSLEPPDGGVYVFDGAMIEPGDAGRSDAGGPGPGDGGLDAGRDVGTDAGMTGVVPDPIPFITNVPGLVVTQPLPAAGEDEHYLRIVHVSYVPDPTGFSGNYLHEWYFVMHNYGSRPACQVRVGFEARNASSAVIVSDDLNFVDGDPYRTAGGLLIECLSPGAEGVVFSNQNTTSPAPLSSVRSISFTVVPGFYDGVVPETEPATIDSVLAFDEFGSGRDRVRGNIRGGARPYRSATPNFYVMSPSGYFVDWMFDTVLDIPVRALAPYETLSGNGRVTRWEQHLDLTDVLAVRGPSAAAEAEWMELAARTEASREADRARVLAGRPPEPID
jgi:hypothetical protein